MSQDTQYTALGPAIVGFQSDGSEIEQGVNVQGNNVGVYAESLAQSPGTRSSPASTGVFGTGDAFGVYAAAGDLVASVNGDASQLPAFLDVANSIAVVGAGLSTPGIIGISDKARPPLASEIPLDPFGIVGISARSPGVVGISDNAHPLTLPTQDAAGVVGISQNSPGVRGYSSGAQGGVFASETVAPINLVPAVNTALPVSGQIGDMIVTLVGDDPTNSNGTGDFNFWLCFVPGDGTATIAQWVPVQFGPAQAGGTFPV